MDARNSGEMGAYVNLGKFLHYRGFTLSEEPLRPSHVGPDALKEGMTPSEVVKTMLTQLGEWEIIARRADGGRDMMVLILLSSDGKFAKASQEFSRLLQSVAKKVRGGMDKDADLEIIVLATEEVQEKKNLQAEIRTLNEQQAGEKYFMYPYHIFSFVVPEVPIVPRHEILSKKEAKQFMRLFQLEAKDITRIPARDPAIVWIGARPGDYISVWRLSESAHTRFPHLRIVA